MVSVHREEMRFAWHNAMANCPSQTHNRKPVLGLGELGLELDQVSELVRHEMEHAAELSVPLVVDLGSGDNWLATKMDS